MKSRRYLGDGVYVHLDDLGRVVLTAGAYTLYIEVSTWGQLLAWWRDIQERLEEEEEEGAG